MLIAVRIPAVIIVQRIFKFQAAQYGEIIVRFSIKT